MKDRGGTGAGVRKDTLGKKILFVNLMARIIRGQGLPRVEGGEDSRNAKQNVGSGPPKMRGRRKEAQARSQQLLRIQTVMHASEESKQSKERGQGGISSSYSCWEEKDDSSRNEDLLRKVRR